MGSRTLHRQNEQTEGQGLTLLYSSLSIALINTVSVICIINLLLLEAQALRVGVLGGCASIGARSTMGVGVSNHV